MLDECSFYCGKARFYPKVECGILVVSRTTSQLAPDQYFNFFLVFLPLFAIAFLLWLAAARRIRGELDGSRPLISQSIQSVS
jgi:hypothetical protein